MHIIAFIVEGLYHLLFTLLHQFMPTLMMYAGIKKQRLTRYILNENARLSALTCAAGCTNKASLLIYQRLVAAIRAT